MRDSGLDAIGRGLAVAAVAYLMSLAPRLAPVTTVPPAPRHTNFEELDARFTSTKWLVNAAMVIAGVAIFFALHTVLLMGQRYFVSRSGDARFVFLPSSAIWWFLPGFAAICLCWETVLSLWGHLGKREDVDLYRYWSDISAGYNATKVLRILALVVVLPIGILTVLAVPMHVSFDDEGISLQGFASLSPIRYSYADIQRISVADGTSLRDGTFQFDPQIVLDFRDARRWSTRDYRDPEQFLDLGFLRFVTAKTQLSPSNVHVTNDIH